MGCFDEAYWGNFIYDALNIYDYIASVMNEDVQSIGEIILKKKNRTSRRKWCPSATHMGWTGIESEPQELEADE